MTTDINNAAAEPAVPGVIVAKTRKQKVVLWALRALYGFLTVYELTQFLKFREHLNVTKPLARTGANDDGAAENYAVDGTSYALFYFLASTYVVVTLRMFMFQMAAVNRLHIVATLYSVYQCFVQTNELVLTGFAKKCFSLDITQFESQDAVAAAKITCSGIDKSFNVSDDYVTAVQFIAAAWYFVVFFQIISVIVNDKMERLAAAKFGARFTEMKEALIGPSEPVYRDEKADVKVDESA